MNLKEQSGNYKNNIGYVYFMTEKDLFGNPSGPYVKIGRVNSDQDLIFAFNNSLVDFWATRLFVERISNKEVLIDRKDARYLGLKEGDSINLSH